jgi:antitoxin PrlF
MLRPIIQGASYFSNQSAVKSWVCCIQRESSPSEVDKQRPFTAETSDSFWYDSYFRFLHSGRINMLISEKGQVTIPKHIRVAAGVAPGSEVSFSLDGGKIVITPLSTSVKNDRREMVRLAAARVRASYSTEFKQLGADEIMNFLRGDSEATKHGL